VTLRRINVARDDRQNPFATVLARLGLDAIAAGASALE
jgi:hypothetical protein